MKCVILVLGGVQKEVIMEPIKVKRKMRESTRCKRQRRRVEGGKLVAWRRLRLFR